VEQSCKQEVAVRAEVETPCRPPRLGTPLAVCSWLSLVATHAVWLFVYLGDLWWPATLLMFSPRWLLALPLSLLILAAAWWRRRSLGILLLALLLLLGPVMGFAWHVGPSASPQGMRVRVLTCNMHYGKPDVGAWLRMLAEIRPDLVAVQELPGNEPDLPFADDAWHLHRENNLFVASRFRIQQSELLGDDSMTPMGLVTRYRLQTPAGELTLFNLHFASPRDGLYEVLRNPGPGIAEMESNSSMRRQQSERLARFAEDVTGPLLLVGDFNTPTESAIFRRCWGRYTDAFTAAGWGWGYTFLGAKTTVRIDHILAGPGWHCERCWIGPQVGSPHRPVVADLIWTETTSAVSREP
jgi:vancomycin resistance protein VanJ